MAEIDLESYPPIFRPKNSPNLGVDSNEADQNVPDLNPLPIIDFESINHEKLSEACKDWGMFRVINHGIPLALLDKLHDHAKKLFSLSFESKQACLNSPMAYFWGTPGLTQSGAAISNRRQSFNWLEGFHFPVGALSQCKYEDLKLESIRALLEEYGGHQTRLATTLFEALALNLQLDPSRSKSYLSPATGHLHVYRYPRCCEAERAWALDGHTNTSVLSILHEDQVGGLQVLYKDDQWLDVKPVFNSLIVNIGDMFQAMSDDIFVAAKQRVKVNKSKERISIGYFVPPDEDVVIKSSKYKPFTYTEFRAEVREDLKTVGYKIGLPKFKLEETS